MAKYRSASFHVIGSEPLSPDDAAGLPELAALPLSSTDPRGGDGEDDELPGPSRHALSRSARVKDVAPAWMAGGAALLALLGLVAWGSQDVFGARRTDAFACPPNTTEAVQAATGCSAPAVSSSYDGDSEE